MHDERRPTVVSVWPTPNAYMVTGSVAVSLYAEPRMTRDVDPVVELRQGGAARVVEMFDAEFTCDAAGSETDRAPVHVNLIHAEARQDRHHRPQVSPYRDEEFPHARRLATIDGVAMWWFPLRT